jgi:exosome complex exonuclease DIS3/RRP44
MSDSDRSYNTDDNDDTLEEEIGFLPTTTAPDLYLTPTYFRQLTRQSKIVKVTTERYLREDLGFGCYYMDDDQNGDNKAVVVLSKSRRQHVDKILGQPRTIESVTQLLSLLTQPSSSLSSTSKTETLLLVVDTNVLLHNLDVLQNLMLMHRPVDGITIALVIPQTSLWECRARQIAAYDRTIELIRTVRGNDQRGISIFFPDLHHIDTANVDSSETSSHVSMSINDENDQRIRNVAEYFGVNLRTTNVRVILLTDDRASRVLANDKQNNNNNNKRINFRAQSVRAFVKELESKHPEMALSDLIAHFTEDAFSDDNAVDPLQQQHAFRFPPHVEANELARGIMTHMYYRGSFRRLDLEAAMVTIRREDERVAITIQGKIDCNRAVDGDVVAIALHPLTKWIPYDDASKATNHIDKVDSASTATASVGIANETADPSLAEENNVPESLTIDGAANWRPTGKVVGIIRRNFGNYSGSIYEIAKTMNDEAKRFNNLSAEREAIAAKYEREHADGSNTCVFFPVNDKKIPPVLIRTTQRDRLLRQRIVVCIDSWPADSPYPLGHYVRTIGPAGSKDVETQVLLHQHDIPHQPFSAAVLACLPPEDYKIDNDNSPGREDLRHLPVLSIDPPGCKDIDDALHCIQLPNGNYQVGVHIADVTHYVKTGTAIDLEAANRSTSTYLVNKRLDMLPGLLTTDLCSLKGNVDRYAFSVLWEVTADDVPEIVNVEFKKTIIHSIAALTYQQAQIMIESDDDPNDIQAAAVKRLASLARQFRKRRIEAGALTLASPEVKCKSGTILLEK